MSSNRSNTPAAKSATATLGMLVRSRPTPVSVATRLAVRRAAWNIPAVSGPAVPAAWARLQACFTCPRIWGSPSTMLSRPAATPNRWRTTASLRSRAKTGASRSGSRPRHSARNATSWEASGAAASCSPAAYSSTRLQVESSTASRPGKRSRNRSSAAAACSAEKASRSRSSSGTVRCVPPTRASVVAAAVAAVLTGRPRAGASRSGERPRRRRAERESPGPRRSSRPAPPDSRSPARP